jgi:hypothetical protein
MLLGHNNRERKSKMTYGELKELQAKLKKEIYRILVDEMDNGPYITSEECNHLASELLPILCTEIDESNAAYRAALADRNRLVKRLEETTK